MFSKFELTQEMRKFENNFMLQATQSMYHREEI